MNVILGADAICYPLTGIGRYAYELAKGLSRSPEVETLRFLQGARLTVVMPTGEAVDVGRADAVRSFKLQLLKSRVIVAAYRKLYGFRRGRALLGEKDALFHGPNYYLPPHCGPCVSTFHDMSVFRHPEFHPIERVRYMEKELAAALQRANVIVTDSEHARAELLHYSGFSAQRVLAVPLAVSADFYPRTEAECAAVLQRHRLVFQGYCLYAGTIEPRKNIARLLDAFEMLPDDLRYRFPLVVVGYRGWKSEVLHERLVAAEAKGWARYLGFVPDEELSIIYAAAKIFAFPSIYEGFGLPVLEAMASGVPVLCSNASSLPEVAGDCALMCDPEDIDRLVVLLERTILDSAWRDAVIIDGMKRALNFSWDKTVAGTLAAYRMALLD